MIRGLVFFVKKVVSFEGVGVRLLVCRENGDILDRSGVTILRRLGDGSPHLGDFCPFRRTYYRTSYLTTMNQQAGRSSKVATQMDSFDSGQFFGGHDFHKSGSFLLCQDCSSSMQVVLFQSFFFEILTPQNSWEDGSNLTLMNIFQFGVAINYRGKRVIVLTIWKRV